jgi:hypothetical protein
MSDDVARKPCPMCGESIAVEARKCRFCGETVSDDPPPGTKDEPLAGMIPYKNPPALVAYYLGLFSLLPGCFPIGIAAFILGLKGLKNVRQHPEVRGTVHAWIGVIMGGFLALLWLAFDGLIVVAMIAESGRGR